MAPESFMSSGQLVVWCVCGSQRLVVGWLIVLFYFSQQKKTVSGEAQKDWSHNVGVALSTVPNDY